MMMIREIAKEIGKESAVLPIIIEVPHSHNFL